MYFREYAVKRDSWFGYFWELAAGRSSGFMNFWLYAAGRDSWPMDLGSSSPMLASDSWRTVVHVVGLRGRAGPRQLLEDAHHVGDGAVLLLDQALRGDEESNHRLPLRAVPWILN